MGEGGASGWVTPDMAGHFRSQGWVKLPPVLSEGQLQEARRICRATEGADSDGLTGHVEGQEATASFSYQQDEKYQQMWSNAFDLRLRFPFMADLVQELASIPRTLLGDDDVRVFWDKTFVKPPAHQGTRLSVWHQDYPYNPIDRRGMLTVWIALEDVTVEMGALRFVPRSHRLGPLGRRDLLSDEGGLDKILTDEDLQLVDDPVTVPLLAGEATVHDALTLHGAGPNLSSDPRRAWTIVYMPGSTLYLGGPHPHASIDALDLVPYEPFDHEQFMVDRVFD